MGRRGTLLVALVACALTAGVLAPAAPVEAASSTAAIPVVNGNLIVDSRTGGTFTPHAVNWPSLEYACQQGWAYDQGGATDAAAAAMASWGINTVRLPLNEQCWLGLEGNPHYGSVSGYRAAVRAWVDKLNAHGIVAVLDLHWTGPPGYQADGQRPMTGASAVTFWQSVATAYATVPSVMFDAFNEPYSRWPVFTLTWQCWRDGGCQAPVENDVTATHGATFTVAGMQSLVTAIRTAGAGQPILLGGLDYSNDLRGWLANRPSDPQLIASWHNYPGQRCHDVACWTSEILPVAAVVPVFTTEFGQTDGGSGYLTSFMTWADAHGIGYAPWAWWVVDASESLEASRYALIANETTFTPKAPSGTAYHDHLASLVPVTPPGAPDVLDRTWFVDVPTPPSAVVGGDSDDVLVPPPAASAQSLPASEHPVKLGMTAPTTATAESPPLRPGRHRAAHR